MKIGRLELETKDLDILASFYNKVLELPVAQTEDECTVFVGTSTVRFKKVSTPQEPFYHFAINIPSNKTEEAKEWLQKRVELIYIEDYKSVVADFVNWNAKSVYFFDAAGNILELIARFDLKNDAAENFNPEHFLSVSEVGLVFPEDEIETKTSRLLSQYKLSYFVKQPPFPNFKAVGDDEGLFIIVTENRNWYPTNKKSRICPIKVQFENGAEKFDEQF
jgi:hypothetical protein